jgi:thiol-disulfide isomerase/thioredoxin
MSMSKARSRARMAVFALVALAFLAGCSGLKHDPKSAQDARPPASQEGPGGAGARAAEPKTITEGPAQDAIKPLPGYRAADFTAVDVFTGEKVTLSDLRGQVVFLNFWATWCGPCKLEMPEMEALQQEMGKRVRIIALGADGHESSEKMGAFARTMGLTFTIANDQGAAAGAYRVTGIPTSFIIDKEGIIRVRHTGPMKLETMKQYIAEAENGPAKQ